MNAQLEIKPAPDRLTIGNVEYIRADLYDARTFEATINKETVEAQAEVIRRLCARLEAMGVRP